MWVIGPGRTAASLSTKPLGRLAELRAGGVAARVVPATVLTVLVAFIPNMMHTCASYAITMKTVTEGWISTESWILN